MNNSDKKCFECDCGTELLHVVRDREFNQYYLAVFRYGFPKKKSIKTRIRLVWQVLWEGTCYEDQIVLSKEEANNLSKFLNTK